ncbi:MAG: hypothetical protein U0P45_16575 [Acidimicrobiales bacterium]
MDEPEIGGVTDVSSNPEPKLTDFSWSGFLGLLVVGVLVILSLVLVDLVCGSLGTSDGTAAWVRTIVACLVGFSGLNVLHRRRWGRSGRSSRGME